MSRSGGTGGERKRGSAYETGGLDPSSIDAISDLLMEAVTELAPMPAKVEAVSGDPDDDLILSAADAAGVEVLISGDRKHLLPLGRYGTMPIMKPQALLAAVAG